MELFKSRTRVAYTNAVGDKVYPVVVDIKKGIKSTEDIQFVSSDVNTGILSVAFISGNENFNVSGADVVCSVMRPDASTLELPCEVVRENIVEVPLGINGTSQDGVYSFDFKVLKGGNKVVGTPIMNYSVSLSIGNDMVIEEDDRLPVLTMLMTQLTELKGEARESINQANVATEASREATANAIEATNNANAVSERVSQETSEVISRVNNKVTEVENRFNALTASQQQSSEVIDARDGETSLKARLDRDIEKAKQVHVKLDGLQEQVSNIDSQLEHKANDNEVRKIIHPITMADLSTDVKSAMTGDSVAVVDIDSVGNENLKYKSVSRKNLNYSVKSSTNLFDKYDVDTRGYIDSNGSFVSSPTYWNSGFINVEPNTQYVSNISGHHVAFDIDKNYISSISKTSNYFTTPNNCYYITIACLNTNLDNFQLNKGTTLLDYEPCLYKDKNLLIELEDIKDIENIKINENQVTFLTKKIGINKFDKTKIMLNKYYNANNGGIKSLEGYSASDFISVEEGKTYIWSSSGHVCLWDENRQYVRGFTGLKTVTINEGEKYITITCHNTKLDTEMFVEGTTFPSTYIPYEEYNTLNNIKINSEDLNFKINTSELKGLKWNVLGDSISSTNYANGKPYWYHIANDIGMTVRNYAVSGAWISKGGNQTISEAWETMDDDADLITVFAGTNDNLNTNPLGTMDDRTNTTFYGALHVLYSGLINKYAGKKIGIISIMLRSGYIAGDGSNWDKKNNAILEVAKYYNLPVFKAHEELNLNPNIPLIKETFVEDGLHPNERAQKEIMARRFKKWLESL